MEQKSKLLFENLRNWNKSRSYCSKIREIGTKARVIVRKFEKLEQKLSPIFENSEKGTRQYTTFTALKILASNQKTYDLRFKSTDVIRSILFLDNC